MNKLAKSLLTRGLQVADTISTPSVITQVQARKLTYLDRNALRWLATTMEAVEKENIAGDVIETGCALGGSSIVITAFKSPARRFNIYDVFGTIPPPSEQDGKDVHDRYAEIMSGKSQGIDGDQYYGYQEKLIEKVRSNFKSFGFNAESNNVHFVRGLYQDTLYPTDPIAFAHIDCDWYDSVFVCLDRIIPLLAPQGRIVIDDYFAYTGCRAAVWDYFRARLDEFAFTYGPRLLITRLES
jgi:hypothetical protein